MGSNKGLTRRSVQEGTAVEVQRPSGTRAMGYGFIGSYQSASGALPLCDPRPSGASEQQQQQQQQQHVILDT